MSADASDLEACVRLLDDPDTSVAAAVSQHIFDMGHKVIPVLQGAMEQGAPELSQQRMQHIVHAFQSIALADLLATIDASRMQNVDVNLELSLAMLNGFGRPADDIGSISRRLDDLALRVHERFIGMSPASDFTQLMAIHSVLYEEEHFRAPEGDYYDPMNSYISSVLDRRQGIPVSLSVLELLIAERSGLDMYGVGLPYHFVVYCPQIDLYVDPFHGGTFLSREDCASFVQRSGLTFTIDMLNPVRSVDIVLRILRNLAFAHPKSHNEWEASTLQRALERYNPPLNSN